MGTFAGEVSLRDLLQAPSLDHFRLGTFAWELSLGSFGLTIVAWELLLGAPSMGSEAGGIELLLLGEPLAGAGQNYL